MSEDYEDCAHCKCWRHGDPCCACGDVPREPDMDDYTGPRGSEAADELAWRQQEARKLK